jgi:hypothetical protein
MTCALLISFLAAGIAFAQQAEPPQTKPAPLDWNAASTSSRSRALEVSSENKALGFTRRDGFWSGTLEKNKPVLIALHLFMRNNYSFSAANLTPGSRIRLSIFDHLGNPTSSEESVDETSATAGISPTQSDRYYIRLELTEGDKAETCVVYSYK